MMTYKMYLAGQRNAVVAVNESGDEPSLSDLPWTIYVETDAVDPLFQKFQREHSLWLKSWIRKNIRRDKS